MVERSLKERLNPATSVERSNTGSRHIVHSLRVVHMDNNNASQSSFNSSVETSSTGDSNKPVSASLLASRPEDHMRWRARVGLKMASLPSAVFQTFQVAQVKPPRNLPKCAESNRWRLEDVSIDEEVKALVESDVDKAKFVDDDAFGIENRWSHLRAIIRGFRRASRNPGANEATGRSAGDNFIRLVFDIDYPTDIISVQRDDVVCFEVPVHLHYSTEYAQTATLDTYVFLRADDSDDFAEDLFSKCYRLRPEDNELANEAYLTVQVNSSNGLVGQLLTAETKPPAVPIQTPRNQVSYGLSSGQLRRRALGLEEATLFGAVYAGSHFIIYAAWWIQEENPAVQLSQQVSERPRVYMSLQASYNLCDIEEFLKCYIALCQIRDYSIKVFQEDLLYLRDRKNLASIVESMEVNRWRTPSVSLDDTPGEFRSIGSFGLNTGGAKEEDMDTNPVPSGSGTESFKDEGSQDPQGSSAGGFDMNSRPGELCAEVTVSGSTSSNDTNVTSSSRSPKKKRQSSGSSSRSFLRSFSKLFK